MDDSIQLEFNDVSVEKGEWYDTGLEGASFRLDRGGLALVRLEKNIEKTPLADAAQGLAIPNEGRILFKGFEWNTMSAAKEVGLRRSIGRVFSGRAWVSNLDVLENITLPHRHFASMSRTGIVAQAGSLAESFGLHEIPKGRPAVVPASTLQISQWVRAFMGSPDLIILENPLKNTPLSSYGILKDNIMSFRNKGTAFLLLTNEASVWIDDSLMPDLRLSLSGSKLLFETRNKDGQTP